MIGKPFTPEQRNEILRLWKEGMLQRHIAQVMGCSESGVQQVIHPKDRRAAEQRRKERRAAAMAGNPMSPWWKPNKVEVPDGPRCRCGLLLPCHHPDPQYPSSGTSILGILGDTGRSR